MYNISCNKNPYCLPFTKNTKNIFRKHVKVKSFDESIKLQFATEVILPSINNHNDNNKDKYSCHRTYRN